MRPKYFERISIILTRDPLVTTEQLVERVGCSYDHAYRCREMFFGRMDRKTRCLIGAKKKDEVETMASKIRKCLGENPKLTTGKLVQMTGCRWTQAYNERMIANGLMDRKTGRRIYKKEES